MVGLAVPYSHFGNFSRGKAYAGPHGTLEMAVNVVKRAEICWFTQKAIRSVVKKSDRERRRIET